MAEELKTADVEAAKKTVTAEQEFKWPMVITLRRPIRASDEEITELKFREPTGGDIERVGCPVVMGDVGPVVEPRAMGAMMAVLAGVPPSTIKMLPSNDWNNGAYALFRFFWPDR